MKNEKNAMQSGNATPLLRIQSERRTVVISIATVMARP